MSFTSRIVVSGLLAIACTSVAQAQATKTKPVKQPAKVAAPAASASMRFAMTQEPAYTGLIGKIADGVAEVGAPPADLAGPPGVGVITEGYYLAISFPDPSKPMVDAKFFRVRVANVAEAGALSLELGEPAAKGVKSGSALMLFRPLGSTTAAMQAAPDFAPLNMGGDDPAKTGRDAALRIQSINNLKQIGLAMHNFHDTFGKFPPAVVNGPDGKPWHSWRVLILPFIDQQTLYQQYKFDEPWDGPNNSKLLDKMPEIYSDPIHGPNKQHFTHYAAFTGEGMAFPAKGMAFDGNGQQVYKELPQTDSALRINNFTDGTSNSLLVGTIGPEQKIPWSKPADVSVGQKLPGLGQKGGFAAPYVSGERKAGLFLFADGHVQEIRDDIKADIFFKLATIGGGEPIRPDDIPGNNGGAASARQVPVIEIRAGENGPTAHLVMEAMPERTTDTLPEPEIKAVEPPPAKPRKP